MSPSIRLVMAGMFAALAACTSPANPPAAPVSGATSAPAALTNGAKAGVYRLDKHHASIVFAVNHLGFSDYVGQFTRFDATLTINPAEPEAAILSVTVDPSSLMVPSPPEGFLSELLGPQWLNTSAFPDIKFESDSVTLTSATTANVKGNLTFLGSRQPIEFVATFNGAYEGFAPYDPYSRAGFSAEGTFMRSAFGMNYGLPPEGTEMGVGDTVKFRVDAEFQGPALEARSLPDTP